MLQMKKGTNIGISMKAWGATLDPKGDSGVRLQGKYLRAWVTSR